MRNVDSVEVGRKTKWELVIFKSLCGFRRTILGVSTDPYFSTNVQKEQQFVH